MGCASSTAVRPVPLSGANSLDNERAHNAGVVVVGRMNEGVAATAVGPTPAAAGSTRDEAPDAVEPTQSASSDAISNAPAAAREGHASVVASTAVEPTPAAPARNKQEVHSASHQHHGAVGHAPASRPSTPLAAVAASARVIASSVNAVAQRHAKLCMDPNGLVRKGRFGDMGLFDNMLEEQVGFADVNPLRGLYAEHCISTDSHTAFSPPNNPGLACTPEGEFFFVVGKDGVNKAEWELRPGAQPTCGGGSMVAGRNAKSVADLLESPRAKRARLRDAEIIALRLYSGPMYAVYNPILRPGEDAAGSASTKNLYPTTIQLIVSGICKLCRVAEAPDDLCVYRGLSGMALPAEFFETDQQGFAGGVEASFMSTTLDEQVTSRAHYFTTEIHVY